VRLSGDAGRGGPHVLTGARLSAVLTGARLSAVLTDARLSAVLTDAAAVHLHDPLQRIVEVSGEQALGPRAVSGLKAWRIATFRAM
jgi:hypothetical protein